MKPNFAFIQVLLLGSAAIAADNAGSRIVKVSGVGNFDVTLPDGWAVTTLAPNTPPPANAKPWTLEIDGMIHFKSPDGTGKISLQFVDDKTGNLADKQAVKTFVESGAKELNKSGEFEKQWDIKELESKNGKCFVAELILSDLGRKRIEPSKDRITAFGVIHFGQSYALINFSGQSFTDKTYAAAKEFITSGLNPQK